MDNQQGDYDENIAQDAGYMAGNVGKTFPISHALILPSLSQIN